MKLRQWQLIFTPLSSVVAAANGGWSEVLEPLREGAFMIVKRLALVVFASALLLGIGRNTAEAVLITYGTGGFSAAFGAGPGRPGDLLSPCE